MCCTILVGHLSTVGTDVIVELYFDSCSDEILLLNQLF